MTTHALSMPDAVDLDVLSIKPKGELQSCNHLLDDHAALGLACLHLHEMTGGTRWRDAALALAGLLAWVLRARLHE